MSLIVGLKTYNYKYPGTWNKLPGFSSTQNITKIDAYPGTKYLKLLTLEITNLQNTRWLISLLQMVSNN